MGSPINVMFRIRSSLNKFQKISIDCRYFCHWQAMREAWMYY